MSRASSLRTYNIAHLPISLLGLFILTFLAGTGRAQTSTNQSISAIDPRIAYTGDWVQQDGGGHVFTGSTASFAVNFTGTAVYWYSRRLYDGASVAVRLDNDDVAFIDLSAGTSENDTRTAVIEVLYEREGLDASERHFLNVSWSGPGGNGVGNYLENYRIEITTTSNATTSSTSASSSATSVSASSSSSSNVGAIVGGTVGGIVGAAALILGMFFLWRRRARRADTESIQPQTEVTPFVSMSGPGNGSLASTPQRAKPGGQPGAGIPSGQQYISQATSSPPVSQDPIRTRPSLPFRSPNSRFTFLPSWYRPRPDTLSNPEESSSPVSPTRDDFPLGRAMPVNPTAPFPPPSSAGTDVQEALHDPPPIYRQ